jgi:hypothetical protein
VDRTTDFPQAHRVVVAAALEGIAAQLRVLVALESVMAAAVVAAAVEIQVRWVRVAMAFQESLSSPTRQ